MPYFDVTSEADKLLLPKEMRTHSELESIAEQAEEDAIGRYTVYLDPANALLRGVGSGGIGVEVSTGRYGGLVPVGEPIGDNMYVRLNGYKVDPNDPAVIPLFKKTFKKEIASLIAWRMRKAGRDVFVQSETTDSVSKTYDLNILRSEFPPTFGDRLRPFVITPRSYVI